MLRARVEVRGWFGRVFLLPDVDGGGKLSFNLCCLRTPHPRAYRGSICEVWRALSHIVKVGKLSIHSCLVFTANVYVGWRGRTLPSLRKQSGEGASQSRVKPNPIQILVPVELLYISKIREIRAGATWAPRRS